MSPLTDLMALGPPLTRHQSRHLQRLVLWWTLLADLSFSDLLLFLPVGAPDLASTDLASTGLASTGPARTGRNSTGPAKDSPLRLVIADQIRATTGRTLYRDDHVGTQMSEDERPFVAAAFKQGRIQTGKVRLVPTRTRAHVTSIPVYCGDRVVAALSREVSPEVFGKLGDGSLERNYLQTFAALADMVATGDFPYPAPALPLDQGGYGFDLEHDELPRVGDGMLLVGDDDVVSFASPNAVSALHRVGVADDVEGKRLDEIGLAQDDLRLPRPRAASVTTEIERYGAAVQVMALPLRNVGREFPLQERPRLGALVLLHDVTALRRRDQLLLSKDRTIAEIHHRVKNNLQTISSLLRIQARRLSSPEASRALQESIRRIGAIALVHEALSTEAADDVDFCGVAHVLADTMRHSLTSQERPIDFVVRCSVGKVPSEMVTPLAVVLNELLQNAVDHAYPEVEYSAAAEEPAAAEPGAVEPSTVSLGTVEIDINRPKPELLRMAVRDDGVGLPEGFDIEKALGLGTSIVRALSTTDLDGTISYSRRQPGTGTVVLVEVPVPLKQTDE